MRQISQFADTQGVQAKKGQYMSSMLGRYTLIILMHLTISLSTFGQIRNISLSELPFSIHYSPSLLNRGDTARFVFRLGEVGDTVKQVIGMRLNIGLSSYAGIPEPHNLDLKTSSLGTETDLDYSINISPRDKSIDIEVIRVDSLGKKIAGEILAFSIISLEDSISPIQLLSEYRISRGGKTQGVIIIIDDIDPRLAYKTDSKFRLYPNPVNDKLYIRSINGALKKWELYTLNGKLITSGIESHFLVKACNLKPGMYAIRLEDEFEQISVQKVSIY